MPDPVPADLRRALAEAVRERLMHRAPVAIPGLGRFVARHEPSRVVAGAGGRRTLHPPADRVVFEPEPHPSHA